MTTEIAVQQQPKLLELMATEYKLDAASFKSVLLKTVFPQQDKPGDKPVTMEQLASFCAVAHEYKLNPLTKEIFAFPSKGGGIVPVVSIDGWISIVQRQPNYNGHKFIYEWAEGKVGGKLLACTCQIYRKDLANPIEHTEFMEECVRTTDVWNKWPRRMLTHKTFIQCARYAFGLSGIYDEDEASRIAENQPNQSKAEVSFEIAMPQRNLPPMIEAQPNQIPSQTVVQTEPVQNRDKIEPGPAAQSAFQGVQALIDSGQLQRGIQQSNPNAIGVGRAKRLYALLNKHKLHTEQEMKNEFLKPLGLEHTHDMPVDIYESVCDWAEGKMALNPEFEAEITEATHGIF